MRRQQKIGVLHSQFANYHVDRIEALAAASPGAEILAVELASKSHIYAWPPTLPPRGARKVTLFPGTILEDIPWPRAFWAEFRTLRSCDVVFVGVSYTNPGTIALAYALRLCGVRVFMMLDSKHDDKQRKIELEMLKPLLVLPYSGALVAGTRHADYVRMLGFRRRPIVQGCDTISLDRIRREGGPVAPEGTAFSDRHFVFVGRFVEKKGLPFLLRGYARYVREAREPRRLFLVGSGEQEAELRGLAADLGIEDRVKFTGFLSGGEVARILSSSLALILPSSEEQWGLVVNEAIAFHLPLIVSENVGARDLLVRNLVNGFVIPHGAERALANALAQLTVEETWLAQVAGSTELTDNADTQRFVEGVKALAHSGVRKASTRMRRSRAELIRLKTFLVGAPMSLFSAADYIFG